MQLGKLMTVGALVIVSGLATADPAAYDNAFIAGDVAVFFCQDEIQPGSSGVGGVCFIAGHLVGDEAGQVTISITDEVASPASGLYRTLNPDMDDIPFCGQLTVTDGVDWDSGQDVLIFTDGVVFGNLAVSPCGTTSANLRGIVDHVP